MSPEELMNEIRLQLERTTVDENDNIVLSEQDQAIEQEDPAWEENRQVIPPKNPEVVSLYRFFKG